MTPATHTQLSLRGYVMAGGASSRFGFDKAQADFDGQPMLSRICALLSEVAQSVSIVAPPGRYERLGFRTLTESSPGQGPLGGIVAALRDARAHDPADSWCLILGCDMPFLTRAWLAYLCQRAAAAHADVVVPSSENGLEPLCACWHTRAAGPLQLAFEEGIRKVTEAMRLLRMEILDEKDWKRFDTANRLFWNMNTQADYDEAKRMLQAERT
ncbi:MAG TPA: molybdenum cofactor guanylyltransferase [Candidatus Acidoferrales bacterium]|nr:molybdenum cofactor guanylyltransferase [Candidatus Acidoferrales bacterium]